MDGAARVASTGFRDKGRFRGLSLIPDPRADTVRRASFALPPLN
jgi:hypothetical protein